MEEESSFGLKKAVRVLDAFEAKWNFHSVQRPYLRAMLGKAGEVGATDFFGSRNQKQLERMDELPPLSTEQDWMEIRKRESELGAQQNENAEKLAAGFGFWYLRDPKYLLLVRKQGVLASLLSAAAYCCGCTHWLKHPLNDQRDERIRQIAATLTPGDTVGCEAQSCALLVFIEERYPELKADLARVRGYDHYVVLLEDGVVLDPVMMTCYPLSKVKEAVVFFEEQCKAIYRLALESWLDEEARGTLIVAGGLVPSGACKGPETPIVRDQPGASSSRFR
jgi:hypothetical protein